jgi:hypothetical protein
MEQRAIVGFGNLDEQQKFLKEYKSFLDHWEYLSEMIKTAFLNRTIPPPRPEVIASLVDLPEDDPKVLAVENKYKSDLIVYTLGRIAVDDFSELLVLAGNGWGIGALKIIRGMYERVVTAAYIAKHPEAATPFADSHWTHRAKLMRRMTAASPGLEAELPDHIREQILTESKRAQDAKRESICKGCGRLKTVDAWTALDLASMAKDLGPHLENLYALCYLEPTAHMHATGAGVSARMVHTDTAWLYKIDTRAEIKMALISGHNVLLECLRTQNDYFSYGLEEEIGKLFTAFSHVWKPELEPNQQPK